MICGIAGGIFFSTHSIISYEDAAIVKAINFLSDSDNLILSEAKISFCNPTKIKSIASTDEYEALNKNIKQDLVSVMMSYAVSDQQEMALVVMDKKLNDLLVISTEEFNIPSDGDEYALYTFANNLYDGTEDFIDADCKKIRKILKEDKKIIPSGRFPKITSDDVDKFIKGYISKGVSDCYNIDEMKEKNFEKYLDTISSKTIKEQAIHIINHFYWSKGKDKYEEYEKEMYYESYNYALEVLDEALEILDNMIGDDTDINELRQKCEEAKNTTQKLIEEGGSYTYEEIYN